MPKKAFNLLTRVHQKRFKNMGFTKKENTGIDTETYQGKVILICDSFERCWDIDNFDDIIKFLTYGKFRKTFNWFYNIKFDFESIIKYLEYGDLINLYHDKKLDYKDYTLTYIDRKFFSIHFQRVFKCFF